MTKFSFEPENYGEKMKEKTKTKILWFIIYLMSAIVGFFIAVGLLGTLGLWPEQWTF